MRTRLMLIATSSMFSTSMWGADLDSLCKDFRGTVVQKKCVTDFSGVVTGTASYLDEAALRIAHFSNFNTAVSTGFYRHDFASVDHDDIKVCYSASGHSEMTVRELRSLKQCLERKSYSLRNLFPDQTVLCESYPADAHEIVSQISETNKSNWISYSPSVPICNVTAALSPLINEFVSGAMKACLDSHALLGSYVENAVPLKNLIQFDKCVSRNIRKLGGISSSENEANEALHILHSHNPSFIHSPKTEVKITFADKLVHRISNPITPTPSLDSSCPDGASLGGSVCSCQYDPAAAGVVCTITSGTTTGSSGCYYDPAAAGVVCDE